jgi:DNA-binding HxlR family transcriptional regulator
LFAQIRGSRCRAHDADLRVRVLGTGLATYPDVTVVCGPSERDPSDANAVTNPTLISARVLSQRLRELEAKKVVSRAVIPTTPPSVEYALTDLGLRLVPAVAAIAGVGEKLGQDPPKPPARRGNTVRRV